MTTITIDRATVEQALEALEKYRKMMFVEAGCRFGEGDAAITNLRAALAQQAEPAQDIHGACPTHCCPVHGCKYMHDDCPVVSGAVQPVYPRNNGCESCADEAEPLNLSDRAVQRRLATQWGYVPAAQAEPVQEPAAWECRAGGLKPLTQRQYDAQTVATKRHYTRIAPPRRTMVPLTEEEILAAVGWERAAMYMKLAPNFPVDEAKKETLTNARAVEKASWEKNHG